VIIEGIDVGVAGALVQETGTSSGATPISIRPMPMASSRASASAPQTPANLFKMAMRYTVPKTIGSNVQYRGDIFAEGLNHPGHSTAHRAGWSLAFGLMTKFQTTEQTYILLTWIICSTKRITAASACPITDRLTAIRARRR
jgi:hypothetical protein